MTPLELVEQRMAEHSRRLRDASQRPSAKQLRENPVAGFVRELVEKALDQSKKK
jgi:hypothetical protein